MGGALIPKMILALLLVGIIMLVRHFMIRRRRAMIEQGVYGQQSQQPLLQNSGFAKQTSGPGVCTGCGAALPADGVFCEQCGTAAAGAPAGAPAGNPGACPACGAEIAEDEAFCSECGAKVKG